MAETTSTPNDEPPRLTVNTPEVDFDDDAAEALVTIGCGAIGLFGLIERAAEQPIEIDCRKEDVEHLEAAMETFHRILRRHEVKEFADDVSAVDDDLLSEAAETFPPVAGLFVDEFALPVDGEIDVAESLAVDIDWPETLPGEVS